ncbi:type I restriction endonuclease subunit R [Staphylococcus sp. HMSC070D05]|uniref:type I restriction endonuclease subunit R n=1 Tax=Staphylococcus sp. HMSC070D05 TaxID=1739538 RepID=UPI0008A2A197|nr:HsdR family type I site-specific deoxyribonuclease [Staphylococcus sp. HMSC070D05]OFO40439.1 type I restriction endonuclease [Staphylococcus sp. HMSC070D05]
MQKFDEKTLEEAIIEMFLDNNYEYLKGSEVNRETDEILLIDDITNFLKYSYPHLNDIERERVINKIKVVTSSSLYQSNKNLFSILNEGFNLKREDASKTSIHINYIDFENPKNNIFKIVNQYTITDNQDRRPDVIIFINGIPISIFEFKSAIEENVTIYNAWEQIHLRYNRDIPNLMRYCFLSVISDGANTRMGTIFTPYEYYYSWNKADEKEKVKNGVSSLKTLIDGAFSKERIIAILRDFIYYSDSNENEKVIVSRYPQFFGAKKVFENIKLHLKPKGDGKGGTYFGATGSGKTNTMLFLSRLLLTHDRDIFNAPTIIILVDREDLANQTSELFENSKKYLKENNVKTIDSRAHLREELTNNKSGGIYICTIQKFEEETGLLSIRNNIICLSDEAHRTQTNIGSTLKKSEKGIENSYGFGYYLRNAFPNATYVGFTGTPIDDTIHVFGDIIEQYTMKESTDDGITVGISYEPRLARVIISDEQSTKIDSYYQKIIEEGVNIEQAEKSKRAMSNMHQILIHPERVKKIAEDINIHYSKLVEEKPEIVQKAMIVTSSREHAYKIYQELKRIRPDWFLPKKTSKSNLSKLELEKLVKLPKVNLIATRNVNDSKEMYDLIGDKRYKKLLEKQFKNINSNFQIAIVVDMWITGFDVPSLAVMYNDKPLKQHTLIQTISRVNRVFKGKEKGIVVDYIGIREAMLEALKKYNNFQENTINDIDVTLRLFKNQLSILDSLFNTFDSSKFFDGKPYERLMTLNFGCEYIQKTQELENRFMQESFKMKKAFEIARPSGKLSNNNIEKAQFYLAIRSILYKQVKDNVPDAEIMNKKVQEMVYKAISALKVENIFNAGSDELFSQANQNELLNLPMPNTKYKVLMKILKKQIKAYSKINKLKAIEFSDRLKKVADKYNNRNKKNESSATEFESIDELSNQIINIMDDLKNEANTFRSLGISNEEKTFYDILVKVRDNHNVEYLDESSISLAKKIKKLTDDIMKIPDWNSRDDIKNSLKRDMKILLHHNEFPIQYNDEIFISVLEQINNSDK